MNAYYIPTFDELSEEDRKAVREEEAKQQAAVEEAAKRIDPIL